MRVSNFTVIYDANVLYPNFLRDVLLRLAVTDLFRARWTEDIHQEWMRSVLRDRPELESKILRTRELMDSHVKDAIVTGYQDLIGGLQLPDPNDRHVLAAAIKSHAQLIITWNHQDFPAEALEPYGVRTQNPDDFIIDLLELDAATVFLAIERHRTGLKCPPFAPDDYIAALQRQRLTKASTVLRTLWHPHSS